MGNRMLNYYTPQPRRDPPGVSWAVGCAVASFVCVGVPLLGFASQNPAMLIMGLFLAPMGVCTAWVGLMMTQGNRTAISLLAAGLGLNLAGAAFAFWVAALGW